MKIVELITPKEIDAYSKSPHDIGNEKKQAARDSTSAYAQGKPISKKGISGAEYSKTNFFPSELQDDAYYAYIEAVKPLMGGNPYVPEIYKIIKVRDKSGNILPRYEMRQYEPSDNFSTIEVLSMLRRINAKTAQTMEDDDASGDDIWNQIVNSIRSATVQDKLTDDEELNQLLEIIRKVVTRNTAFQYDMHGGNFLIRRTPYGPQLVITDPVQDGGYSTTKSSGVKPWGHKRDTLDRNTALSDLTFALASLVSNVGKPNQADSDRVVRKVGLTHKIDPKELTDLFIKKFGKTPVEVAQNYYDRVL